MSNYVTLKKGYKEHKNEIPDIWTIKEMDDGTAVVMCIACPEEKREPAITFFMNYNIPCCEQHYKHLCGAMDVPEKLERELTGKDKKK